MKQGSLIFILIYSGLTNASNCEPLNSVVQNLILNQLPSAHVGIYAINPKNGQVIIDLNSGHHFIPASNLKIFSSYAALKVLGPSFQYSTSLSSANDDWVLKFSGDPAFTSKHLAQLFIDAKKNPAVSSIIQGDLVVDDTLYQDGPYGIGWSNEDLQWGFGAPVSALIIDENTANLKIYPHKLNEPVTMKLQPPYFSNLKINYNVRTASSAEAEKNCRLEVKAKENVYTFNGCWPIHLKAYPLQFAVTEPRFHLKTQLLTILKEAGIKLKGDIVFKKTLTTHSDAIFASHQSPPLSLLLKKVLTDSNNLYANSITKMLDVHRLQKGTLVSGVNVIENTIESIGLKSKQMHLVDGAGLSFYNKLTPKLIVDLLEHIYLDSKLRDIFYNNLAVAGERGSLEYRMPSHLLKGRVFAKTGTLTHVVNLSGYIRTQNGEDLIFSILINNATDKRVKIDKFITSVTERLVTDY